MKVLSISVGAMDVNCYIVYGDESIECAIVDPGDDADKILDLIERTNLRPKYILLTHGHFDHIGAVKEIKEKTGAQIAIHPEDAQHLTDESRNLSSLIGKPSIQLPPDILVEDGDTLEVGNITLKVIHTPGHTKGGVTYMGENILFTGDTLFEGSVGRTDFPGGNFSHLMKSISEKLMTLDMSMSIYPGHGGKSTLAEEGRFNIFLQDMEDL